MLTVKQIMDKYGKPGDPSLSTTLKFPYPMKLAWAPETIVHSTSCHKLVEPQFTKVFEEILSHYGIDEIKIAASLNPEMPYIFLPQLIQHNKIGGPYFTPNHFVFFPYLILWK